jgi:protein-S-isoprenylcysteine O-methyltransferase Ste14
LKSVSAAKEVQNEALGNTYDPGLHRWMVPLTLAELTVFLDYGHWHLVPALVSPIPQTIGLVVWGITPLWLLWADKYLKEHFGGSHESRIITAGPFHLVRHPRYAGVLVSRAAFALLFASVLGWIFTVAWVALVLRRIGREENHMRERYGAMYGDYASNTRRLIPGIY